MNSSALLFLVAAWGIIIICAGLSLVTILKKSK